MSQIRGKLPVYALEMSASSLCLVFLFSLRCFTDTGFSFLRRLLSRQFYYLELLPVLRKLALQIYTLGTIGM